MAKLRQAGLPWQVPIVDPNGLPTAAFMRWWQTQRQINDAIPALSTSAEVSAVLDVLSQTPGSILRRGNAAWGPLASPGGTSKYLRADGAYATPPDTTYSLATDSAAGLMPKLSGVATEYLDGTGAFSTPAGGGGASYKLAHGTPTGFSNDATATATQGVIIHPLSDVSIHSLFMPVKLVSGGIYNASLFKLSSDSSGATLSDTVLGTSVSSSFSGLFTWLSLPLSADYMMTAGNVYGIALSRTDGSDSSAVQIGSGNGGMGITPGPWYVASFFNLNHAVPTDGQTLSGYATGMAFNFGFYGTW